MAKWRAIWSTSLRGDKLGVGKTPGVTQAKINDPSGGATTDTQARAAINSIIDALEAVGITASS